MACARVKSPTTGMSTPIEHIQSGIAIQTNPGGSPDENDGTTTVATRENVFLRTPPGAPPTGSIPERGLQGCSPGQTCDRPRSRRERRYGASSSVGWTKIESPDWLSMTVTYGKTGAVAVTTR